MDAKLRWRHSDILFTAPLAGREAFIYVLVEHQSGTDELMPLRMLRYMMRIWDRYLTEHPKAKRLPAVVPLVVHHDRRPWSGPTDIRELLDLDPLGRLRITGVAGDQHDPFVLPAELTGDIQYDDLAVASQALGDGPPGRRLARPR